MIFPILDSAPGRRGGKPAPFRPKELPADYPAERISHFSQSAGNHHRAACDYTCRYAYNVLTADPELPRQSSLLLTRGNTLAKDLGLLRRQRRLATTVNTRLLSESDSLALALSDQPTLELREARSTLNISLLKEVSLSSPVKVRFSSVRSIDATTLADSAENEKPTLVGWMLGVEFLDDNRQRCRQNLLGLRTIVPRNLIKNGDRRGPVFSNLDCRNYRTNNQLFIDTISLDFANLRRKLGAWRKSQ